MQYSAGEASITEKNNYHSLWSTYRLFFCQLTVIQIQKFISLYIVETVYEGRLKVILLLQVNPKYPVLYVS